MTPDDGMRPASPPPAAGPRRRRVAALAALVALALAGAAALRIWGPAGGGGEAPLLRAEPGPLRERPDDPGGMEIPYRDVLALHELGMPPDEAAAPAVERLLPPPEEPLPKPGAPEEPEGGTAVAPLDAPTDPEGGISVAPLDAPDAAAQVPAAPEPEPAPPPVAEPAAAEPPAAEPDPAAPPPAETGGGEAESAPAPADPDPADPIGDVLAGLPDGAGAFAVQLGAWSSRAEAEAGWARALARAPELLEPVGRFVAAPEDGDGAGGLHRLRAGPLPDRAGAEALCAGLADAGVPCFVVAQ